VLAGGHPMLSRRLCRAVLAAAPVSLLALTAAPASAAPAAPAGSGFGSPAARQLTRDLRAALQISKGQGVTVAVLDGGVAASAPGLAGVVTTGPSFGNVAGDTPAEGTVFASAVAGRGPSGSNPAGTVGLAPAARILSIKVPNRAGGGTWQRDIGAAIRYAASHGAQVIYVSEESFQDDAVLDSAVEYATARNAVVISPEFTFRNAPPSVSTVPDSLPGVLGAASVVLPGLPKPPHGMRYPANESILVAAPANALTVSGPLGQGYEMFDSLASAAWLTATVALIKSVYPHLPASLVDLAIARSARDHPRAGWSPQVGFGLINPDGALHQAAALAKVPVTAPAGRNSLAGSAHFGAGPPPGVIAAVHHSTSKEALFAAAMAAGLVLLVIAAALAFSWRKSPRRKLENPTGA
jgi:hypothetical protein